jgi:hypothetical protein
MPPGEELAQPDPLEAGRSRAKEIAQATDHVGRALGFRLHASDHIAQPLAGFTGSEQMLTRLGVHQQRGQWLMKFVRQGAGHLAGSREAQRLLQFGTQPLLLIDHDADEESRQGENHHQHFQFEQGESGKTEQARRRDDAEPASAQRSVRLRPGLAWRLPRRWARKARRST